MSDLTVIYYTSNREDGAFEEKIRQKLLETIGDLPLISVSQKPMDFGENICVGDIGVSNQNAHRQFQVGAKAAKTKFVCAAEADFLYPREYFDFRPPRDDRAYRADNLYVLWGRGGFHPKATSEGATVVGRDYVVEMIERSLEGRGMWRDTLEANHETAVTFKGSGFEQFHTEIPIVTFKTRRGMHIKTPNNRHVALRELPYWGEVSNLRQQYEVL
jgi:hypothetical protein